MVTLTWFDTKQIYNQMYKILLGCWFFILQVAMAFLNIFSMLVESKENEIEKFRFN